MRKQYLVDLSASQREELQAMLGRGIAKTRRLTRARILLLADQGKCDREIVEALGVGMSTVERARRKYWEAGGEHALGERPRPGAPRKLNGAQEGVLIALACSEPPDGCEHWTMYRLAERLIELEEVEAISDETVRRTLKKTISNPGRSSSGASATSLPSSSGAWKMC